MNLPNAKIFFALCRSALALVLLALSIAPDAHANGMSTQATRQQPTAPLETLLNSDGTLNLSTGFSGGLNISGWRMALAADGTPHFSRARDGEHTNNASGLKPASLSDDVNWDGRFDYPPGAVGLAVDALAVDGTDLYVGGFFTTTGSLSVNNVARWNPGSGWSALGNGVSGIIFALAVSGSTVYAGGIFIQACGNSACNSGNTAVNNIAAWNGSSWSALGNGVNNGVEALAVSGNTVYAGGGFTQVCGNLACNSVNTTANRVAMWNGNASAWSALGSGMNSSVFALGSDGPDLYAGGLFTTAGGKPSFHFALWNKTIFVYLPLILK